MSLHDLLTPNWIKLGAVKPTDLGDTRLQAHWAAQLPAAVGVNLIPKRADDSHTALEWLDRLQALVGEEAPGGYRVGVHLQNLKLLLLDKDGSEYDSVSLAGRTLDEATSWLVAAIEKAKGAPPHSKLERPAYDMPAHPVGSGVAFETDTPKLGELARWFANADRVLQLLAAREREAGHVLCWPHHFDAATLLMLDPYKPAEQSRTIGIGMSPGDGSYNQPYFYVTPWPRPQTDSLPAIRGGTWHRRDWMGAVLTGSKLTASDDGQQQVKTLTEFLESALAACRELLAE